METTFNDNPAELPVLRGETPQTCPRGGATEYRWEDPRRSHSPWPHMGDWHLHHDAKSLWSTRKVKGSNVLGWALMEVWALIREARGKGTHWQSLHGDGSQQTRPQSSNSRRSNETIGRRHHEKQCDRCSKAALEIPSQSTWSVARRIQNDNQQGTRSNHGSEANVVQVLE